MQKVKVRVPAGGILLFHHSLVHEIPAQKSRSDILRLFLGWRLTQQRDPVIQHIDQLLVDQAVIPLKSGQTPQMYGKNHWSAWRGRIVDFTQSRMKDMCTETKTVNSGEHKGSTIRVVHQHMRSLASYGLPKYPEYVPDELSMYKPSQEWFIEHGCDGKKHVRLSDFNGC